MALRNRIRASLPGIWPHTALPCSCLARLRRKAEIATRKKPLCESQNRLKPGVSDQLAGICTAGMMAGRNT